MSHDWLLEHVRCEGGIRIHEELEPFLRWDHHYWLQRGSLHLECGELDTAQNFLNQAYSLNPTDGLVLTERGYLSLRLAVMEASPARSRELLREGLSMLDEAMDTRLGADPHQYQILASQILEWIRRPDATVEERRSLLVNAAERLGRGREEHPRDERLRKVFVELTNATLALPL